MKNSKLEQVQLRASIALLLIFGFCCYAAYVFLQVPADVLGTTSGVERMTARIEWVMSSHPVLWVLVLFGPVLLVVTFKSAEIMCYEENSEN